MRMISIEKDSTYEQIMAIAKELIQSKGYNGFSYADVALHVGIRKATIHYHFPNKSDLARIVVARYREDFCHMLKNIEEQTSDPYDQIEMYIELYRNVLEKSDRICMCGMLSAEFSTLPQEVSQEVRKFFSENEQWLTKVIKLARKLDSKSPDRLKNVSEQEDAWLLLSVLEGAMLVARTHEGLGFFTSVAKRLLRVLGLRTDRITNSPMIKELDEIKVSSQVLQTSVS